MSGRIHDPQKTYSTWSIRQIRRKEAHFPTFRCVQEIDHENWFEQWLKKCMEFKLCIPHTHTGMIVLDWLDWLYQFFETYIYKPSNQRIIKLELLYINIYNLDILVRLVKFVRLHILDCMHDFKTRQHATEDRMLPIKPGCRICCDKKLRSIGSWTCVCHADSIRSDDDTHTQKSVKRLRNQMREKKNSTGHASNHPKIHLQILYPKLTFHQSHHPADLQFGS